MCELNEAGFEAAARDCPRRLGMASPATLNQLLVRASGQGTCVFRRQPPSQPPVTPSGSSSESPACALQVAYVCLPGSRRKVMSPA